MKTNLIEFHEKCKLEYNELIKHFNILFYGYGNKEPLLKRIFPDAILFNMKFSTLKSITEELMLQGYGDKMHSTIKDIDELLSEKITLVLFNFDFECREFENLKNIRLIGTIENLNMKLEMKDLESYNFILRDLTTFEDYDEDIFDIELFNNNVLNITLIMKNLSLKSKSIFVELVKTGNCEIDVFFDKIKKKFFLTKISTLLDLLKEFVDHKVIKIQDNKIKLILNEHDKNKLLESITNPLDK